jgi:hypothetical protein
MAMAMATTTTTAITTGTTEPAGEIYRGGAVGQIPSLSDIGYSDIELY